MISLRPPLITERHSVSSQSDLARDASPSSRYLRPACDADTTWSKGIRRSGFLKSTRQATGSVKKAAICLTERSGCLPPLRPRRQPQELIAWEGLVTPGFRRQVGGVNDGIRVSP